MTEMLRQIPGPIFLAVFAMVAAATIYVARKWVVSDGTDGRGVPEPDSLDPIALAMLRGGWHVAVRTAMFDLYQNQRILITGSGRSTMIEAMPDATADHPLQQELLAALGVPQLPRKILFSQSIGMLQQERRMTGQLIEAGLLRSGADQAALVAKVLVAALIMDGFGAAKLAMGLQYRKPVGFLVIELIVATVVLLAVTLSPGPRLTTLGRAFLRRARQQFEWMRRNSTAAESPSAASRNSHPQDMHEHRQVNGNDTGIDPAFYVALFGVTAIAMMPAYDAFAEAYPQKRETGGCGSGCSSGPDSSTSSDSGSSSDGGGDSGGGGGCGGCGGGD